jgi:hypothetical protein
MYLDAMYILCVISLCGESSIDDEIGDSVMMYKNSIFGDHVEL